MSEGKKHLVIPDAHAKPGIDNRRFDWLGQIIMDERPDTIICIGDFADMESLSSYDKGKRGFEGRRYHKDVEAAKDAMTRVMAPMNEYNARQRDTKHHDRQYKPRLVMCLGNHENRIDRATNDQAEFDGLLSVDNLGYADMGWEVHPFLEEVEVDGVHYSHYFVSGVMAKAIGGENPATMLLNKQHKSCTAGHSHLADWSQRRQVGGQHIMGCVVGCFFEHHELYVPPSVSSMWWRGLVIKENVVNGCYDPRFLSMNTIKHRYLKEGQPWSIK